MTGTTQVWRLVTHHKAAEYTLRWVRRQGRVAIGWGKIGDVLAQGYASPEDISHSISIQYPELNNAAQGGRCLYDFCFRVKPGDLIIISTGKRRALVMEVTGKYEFKAVPEEQPIGDYQHQRSATIVPIDANELWRAAGGMVTSGYSIRWTLVLCSKPVDADTKARLMEK